MYIMDPPSIIKALQLIKHQRFEHANGSGTSCQRLTASEDLLMYPSDVNIDSLCVRVYVCACVRACK